MKGAMDFQCDRPSTGEGDGGRASLASSGDGGGDGRDSPHEASSSATACSVNWDCPAGGFAPGR